MTHERQHFRRDWACDVEVEWAGAVHPARARNISLGGLYVDMADPPPVGQRVLIHARLPGIPDACILPSVVRWSQPGDGFGAQFESLRAVEVWALNRLLRSLAPAE
ncbi:MAG: PilZ domain-containing protein [Proteobacteria bacterium]|nr:PilZ domain-containing protein [Pseudomonadota bacterium]